MASQAKMVRARERHHTSQKGYGEVRSIVHRIQKDWRETHKGALPSLPLLRNHPSSDAPLDCSHFILGPRSVRQF